MNSVCTQPLPVIAPNHLLSVWCSGTGDELHLPGAHPAHTAADPVQPVQPALDPEALNRGPALDRRALLHPRALPAEQGLRGRLQAHGHDHRWQKASGAT